MSIELEGLAFEIEASAGNSKQVLDELTASLKKLQKAVKVKLDPFCRSLQTLQAAMDGLQSGTPECLERLGNALSSFSDLSKLHLSADFAPRIRDIADAAASITPDVLTRLQDLGAALQRIAAAGSLSFPSSISIPAVTAAPSAAAGGTEETSAKATHWYSKPEEWNAFIASVTKARSAVSGFDRSFRKLVLSPLSGLTGKLKKAISGFGELLRSVKRIAMYRLIRTVLKEISQGFSEGVSNLYQYSSLMGTVFAQSMDSLATSALYLKNSLGAMAAPLINAVAPAVDLVVDKLVDAINLLNQFLAKLTGASTWTKALKYPVAYGDAVSDASDAVKDFIMGFDELNVISDTDTSSSVSGLDYSSMFTEVPLNTDFGAWIDAIKEAIANGEWYEVGRILGEKTNEAVAAIPAETLGRTLGDILNNGVLLANGYLETTNFVQIGSKIAEFFNGALESIDFSNIGVLIANSYNSAADTVRGFVEELDWELAGQSLSDLVNGWIGTIDLTAAVRTLDKGLDGILTTFHTFLTGTDFQSLGVKVGEAINQLVLDLPNLVQKGAVTFSSLVKGMFDFTGGILRETDWKQLGANTFTSLKNMIEGLDAVTLMTDLFLRLGETAVSLTEFLAGFFEETISSSYAMGIAAAEYDESDPSRSGFWNTWAVGAQDMVNALEESDFGKNWTGFWETVGETTYNALHHPLSDALADMEIETANSQANMNASWTDCLSELKSNWTTGWEDIKTKAADTWSSMQDNWAAGWDSIRTAASEKWNSIKEKLSGIPEWFKTKFDSAFSFVKEAWENAGLWASETAVKIKAPFVSFGGYMKDIFTAAVEGAKAIFDGFKEKLTPGINGTMELAEGFCNAWIDGFNAIADFVNNFNFQLPDWAGGYEIGISLPSLGHISLPRFAEGGFPDEGQLFIAREAGAEMVGNIGNRTAVANNDQIVKAVAEGVYAAMLSAMQSQTNSEPAEFHVYLSGKQIAAEVKKVQREQGKTIFSGGVVNV